MVCVVILHVCLNLQLRTEEEEYWINTLHTMDMDSRQNSFQGIL